MVPIGLLYCYMKEINSFFYNNKFKNIQVKLKAKSFACLLAGFDSE